MAKKLHRGERLGEEIRRILGELLLRELKGPGFEGMITISYVKAADDGSFATVYFTTLTEDEDAVIAAFEKAKGFIRSEINGRLGLRHAPDLRFLPDHAEKYGQHIDAILSGLDIPKDDAPAGRVATASDIADLLDAYERFAIFTHVHMDGDTLGSAVALALALKEVGKEAFVVVSEEVPRTIAFIQYGAVWQAAQAKEIMEKTEGPYLGLLLDFSSRDRIECETREAILDGAAETACVDHHVTARAEADWNFVETGAAATAEIVFRLLTQAGLPLTDEIATALYVGIVTDTGRFQYSATTPETHRIAATLLEAGADVGTAYQEIYQNVKAEKLLVERAMLDTFELFAEGRGAIAGIGADALAALGAGEDETDGMSEKLRSIIGVEVSVFLRELGDGRVKASMRSKELVNVAEVAAQFDGGGHVRAAGFTVALPMADVARQIKEKLTEALAVAG
ncbi:MAG: 30S ribosome-binding factor RbfA [Clostridiales Family XIII bacterium]|jgi:phosphoesterase RecJ-like protein|nr:30S ribosome-binding factor RbfA [Clostridiales Family XIII bacterium]